MECPGCGRDTHKLVFDSSGGGCEFCIKAPSVDVGGVVVRGVNKYKPKMSHNEMMHISTRHIGTDGKIHSAPRYETKDY